MVLFSRNDAIKNGILYSSDAATIKAQQEFETQQRLFRRKSSIHRFMTRRITYLYIQHFNSIYLTAKH